MHGDMRIAGWFPTAIIVLAALIFLGSLAVFVDSIRRPKSHFGKLGRWPYTLVTGAFLTLSILGVLLPAGLTYTAALGIGVLVLPVLTIVYLLRVVFPTRKRLETREGQSG